MALTAQRHARWDRTGWVVLSGGLAGAALGALAWIAIGVATSLRLDETSPAIDVWGAPVIAGILGSTSGLLMGAVAALIARAAVVVARKLGGGPREIGWSVGILAAASATAGWFLLAPAFTDPVLWLFVVGPCAAAAGVVVGVIAERWERRRRCPLVSERNGR